MKKMLELKYPLFRSDMFNHHSTEPAGLGNLMMGEWWSH